jgi:catechol 2,3-dioxygenase-like lactoylglutathione lyase family enzyme
MGEIVAPDGSPLAVAVLGSRSLEASLAFYVDCIGFDAGPVAVWSGVDFERFWELPPGSSARSCLLTAGDCAVGRVLLLEFSGSARELVQAVPNSQVIGLANLNFYTADARAAVAGLRAQGYRFWSDPTQHSLNAGVGNPIEVIFDGPDGVSMNLVELTSRDPGTRIGQMRAYVEKTGYTRRGFTPVVTTSHVTRSADRACEFYEIVCGRFCACPRADARKLSSCRVTTCSARSRCRSRSTIWISVGTCNRPHTRLTSVISRRSSRCATSRNRCSQRRRAAPRSSLAAPDSKSPGLACASRPWYAIRAAAR